MKNRFDHIFIMILFCAVFLFCSCAVEAEAPFYHDRLAYYGHAMMIDAIAALDYPLPLQEIALKGAGLDPGQVFDALGTHFDLHPAFQLNNHEKYYLSYGANSLKDNYGYTPDPYFHVPIDQIFPVLDPVLTELSEQCLTFLNAVGIQGNPDAGFACYFSGRDIIPASQFEQGKDYRLRILIPYDIEGLSMEYRNMLVPRGETNAAGHILDYPFAVFAFDDQLQLITVQISCFAVTGKREIGGSPISWQKAIETAMDTVMEKNPSRKGRTVDEYRDAYFSQYSVRVARILPMWLPDWGNALRPGWCVQFHLYDRSTGEFLLAYDIAVDAATASTGYRRSSHRGEHIGTRRGPR